MNDSCYRRRVACLENRFHLFRWRRRFFCASQHRLDVFVILAGERLGGQDDLMFGIDQGLGVVAVDDAVRRSYLDRFIIHRVALVPEPVEIH